jgi:hypothetical protein
MGRQIDLWKARKRGKKQARLDFEQDTARHLHLSVGTPTPRADTTMEAYIKKGLGYLSFEPSETPVTWLEYAEERQ